jgi:hypothetical protein
VYDDNSAASVLLDIVRHYHDRDVRVCFVHLRPEIQQLFERAGIVAELNTRHALNLFATLREAVVTLQEHIQQQTLSAHSSPSATLTSQPSASIVSAGGVTTVEPSPSSTIQSSSVVDHDSGSRVMDDENVMNGIDRTPLLHMSSPDRERKPSVSSHTRRSSSRNLGFIGVDMSSSPSSSTASVPLAPLTVDHGSPGTTNRGLHIRRSSNALGGGPLTPSSSMGMTVRLKSSTSYHQPSHFADEVDIPVLQQSPIVLLEALGRQPSFSTPLRQNNPNNNSPQHVTSHVTDPNNNNNSSG